MSECLCDQCSALCCRYFALPIDNPETARQFDDIRWYLCHENVVVFVEKKQWYLGILTRCKHLQDDNRCGIYETRPKVCRGYSTENCDYHGGEYDYQKLFTSAEQLREYALEFLKKKRERKRREKPPTAVQPGSTHKNRGAVRGHPSRRGAVSDSRSTSRKTVGVAIPFKGNGERRMALPVLRA